MRHTAYIQCDKLWRNNTAPNAKRNVSVAWKSFNESSDCYHSTYHDDLPTLVANVDRPSWVFVILSFRNTDISHLVGERGRQKSSEFACVCVFARGFLNRRHYYSHVLICGWKNIPSSTLP